MTEPRPHAGYYRPPMVVVLRDTWDDAGVAAAITRHCERNPKRLLIAPMPGHHTNREMAVLVHMALGAPEPPPFPYAWFDEWRRAPQLELFPERWEAEASGVEQLSLFATEVARWERWRYVTQPHLQLFDAAGLLSVAGIAELYVLGAQALSPGTWVRLRRLAELAGLRLHLVLSGLSARPLQRQALKGCQVRERSAPGARTDPPATWWSSRGYHASDATNALPERFARPGPSRTYRLFAIAAQDVMAGAPGDDRRSFLTMRSPPPPPRPRISAEAMAQALRRVLGGGVGEPA